MIDHNAYQNTLTPACIASKYGRAGGEIRKTLENSAAGCAFAAGHEGEALEKLYILFIFQECPVKFRKRTGGIGTQVVGGQIFGEKELEPVEHFGRRRFFLEARCFADVEKTGQSGCEQVGFDPRVMDVDNLLQRICVGEPNVMEKAAAQEGVWQLFFVV